MKRRMNVWALPAVLVVSWFVTGGTTSQAIDLDKSFRLPVLVVQADGKTGAVEYVEFTLTRKATAKTALSIAVAEDTPGGAGDSVRASVWMATIVAALDRLDDLSGTRISIQIPGQLDGPSAGGVVCLAILSALDGRNFPKDVAMTGAIMPDGTVGGVGGVALKMQAASKAGIKRILVPAFLRFVEGDKPGEEIDLKRLAASLKLEYIPVESIADA